jgi:23S rRNA (uracil1939-C5)-methyltransferase
MSGASSRDAMLEIELTDLAYGGDAVGRHDGRAVFVPGGIPGERVRIRIVGEKKNLARGELTEVLSASPERVAPRYPELGESGGFQWQHIAYPAQLRWKTHIVTQLLRRVGRFAEPPVRPIIGMHDESDRWRYRTVAQFAVGADGAIGFRRVNSHVVIDMPDCPLVHPRLDALYSNVRAWMLAKWDAEAADYTQRFTLHVAANPVTVPADGTLSTSQGLLIIEARPGGAFTTSENPAAIADTLRADLPGLAGVVIAGLPGEPGRVVAGAEYLFERVLGKTFRVSAGSFFQVNPTQTPVLVREARAAAQLSHTDHLLDGYSGVGLFSLILADEVADVLSIESVPSAVADARANVDLNHAANVTTVEGALDRVLGRLQPPRDHVDVALVDPPRAGCSPRALGELQRLAPRTFVYVSCDPSTLARDLRVICDNGYRLVSVQPVDMFPFTAHIECVAHCERIN